MKTLQLLSLATLAAFTISNAAIASDGNDGEQPIMLAAGFGDMWNSVKESATGVFTQKDIDAIEQLPPPGAGNRRLNRAENREIQQKLSSLGYDPGPADGLPGKKTKSAIYAYQRDKGLAADGEPSGQMLATLRSEVPNSASGGYRSGPEPIEVELDPNLRPADRQAYYACADSINRQRQREGRPEIELTGAGGGQTASQILSVATSVLGFAQQLGIGGGLVSSAGAASTLQYAQLGTVAAAQAANAQATQQMPAQQMAIAELQRCAAGYR